MRKLSDVELTEFIARFSDWQSPEDFERILWDAEAIVGFLAVGDGRMKVWREGFVAMSCAQLSLASRLRLGDDPPDFELDYGDHRRSFELVDVLPNGSRRTGEHAKLAKLANAGEPLPIEHFDAEQELLDLPADFRAQLEAKAAKKYPAGLILVTDIQHFLVPSVDEVVERRLAKTAAEYLDFFEEIWIRRSASIIRVSQMGASRMISIRPRED